MTEDAKKRLDAIESLEDLGHLTEQGESRICSPPDTRQPATRP
jgi:hypothetical protein